MDKDLKSHHFDQDGSEDPENAQNSNDEDNKNVDSTSTGISSNTSDSENQKIKQNSDFFEGGKKNDFNISQSRSPISSDSENQIIKQNSNHTQNANDIKNCQRDFLSTFCESREEDLMLLLKKEVVDVNSKTKDSELSLLHLSSNNENVTRKLIEKFKAEVNNLDLMKCSPLHHAVWNGNYEVAKLLVRSGADVNQIDIHGETPLFFAVKSGKKKLIELLLKSGALISLKNRKSESILDLIEKMNDKEVAEQIVDVLNNYLYRKMKKWKLIKMGLEDRIKTNQEYNEKKDELKECKNNNEKQKRKIKKVGKNIVGFESMSEELILTIDKLKTTKEVLQNRLNLSTSAVSSKTPFKRKKNFSRHFLFEKTRTKRLLKQNEVLNVKCIKLKKERRNLKQNLLHENTKLKKKLKEMKREIKKIRIAREQY